MPRDALAEIASFERQPKEKCRAVAVFEDLDKDLHAGLLAALAPDSGLTSTAISRWLNNEGIEISSRTIGRHRTGACVCP